jgi:hypothetical protein
MTSIIRAEHYMCCGVAADPTPTAQAWSRTIYGQYGVLYIAFIVGDRRENTFVLGVQNPNNCTIYRAIFLRVHILLVTCLHCTGRPVHRWVDLIQACRHCWNTRQAADEAGAPTMREAYAHSAIACLRLPGFCIFCLSGRPLGLSADVALQRAATV